MNDLSLNDITAPSLLTDSTIKAIISSLDPELKAIAESIPEAVILKRLDDLPENVLDALAWQFHADYYDLAADISMKREHVRSVLKLHQKKGTVWAIREALRLMDIEAEFIPWWQTGDPAYTFRLRAVIGGNYYKTRGREALMKNLRRAVEDTKSARSYLTQAEAFLYDREHYDIFAATKSGISGNTKILIDRQNLHDNSVINAGVIPATGGNYRIRIVNPDGADMALHAGVVSVSEMGICISPPLEDIAEMLAKFEQRFYLRLELCEHNILLPALDMINRVQRLDDFIHDCSPKYLYPAIKAGVLPLTSGAQTIRNAYPDDPLAHSFTLATIPLLSGNMTLRNHYPDEQTGLKLFAGINATDALDVFLGMSSDELRNARTYILNPGEPLTAGTGLAVIPALSGHETLRNAYPDDATMNLLAKAYGTYGLDVFLGMSGDELRNARTYMLNPGEPLTAGTGLAVIPALSGHETLRNAYPDDATMNLLAKAYGTYGLDVFLGMSRDELRNARTYMLKSQSNITASAYLATVTMLQGKSTIGIHQPTEDNTANLFGGIYTFEDFSITIRCELPEKEQGDVSAQGNIFAGILAVTQGTSKISPNSPGNDYQSMTFHLGLITDFEVEEYIFVEEDILQELLLQFENRIFARLDEHIAKEDAAIADLTKRVARLEKLIEPED